jgi:predicted neuraminidase
VWARTSTDAGLTWDAPVKILPQNAWAKVTANPLVVTQTGSWLLPYWDTHQCEKPIGDSASYSNVTARVLISNDRGATWTPSGGCFESSGLGLIEGTLLVRADGRVLQYFRTGKSVLYESVSSDGGFTWPNATATSILNPDAKVCLYSNATLPLLAYNDDTKGRTPLTLAKSDASVSSWVNIVDIESTAGSFAYPTVVRQPLPGSESVVLVSYSYNYQGIKLAHVLGMP